jgi:hypothetical protein
VPFGIGDGLSPGIGSQDRRVLFYATLHQHPMVGGYIGRMPLNALDRYANMSVARALIVLSEGHALAPSTDVLAPPPCRYLVVHRAASSSELLAYVRRLPADLVVADETRDLYKLR